MRRDRLIGYSAVDLNSLLVEEFTQTMTTHFGIRNSHIGIHISHFGIHSTMTTHSSTSNEIRSTAKQPIRRSRRIQERIATPQNFN